MSRMNVTHPNDTDLAALAGGELDFLRRYSVERHLRQCETCQAELASFRSLRDSLADVPMPALDWNTLAVEMRANIHVGLEAGACVGEIPVKRAFSPRLAAAFASLVLLAGAGFYLHNSSTQPVETAAAPAPTPSPEYRMPVLESSNTGLELRTGPASFALLNREGTASSQTISADGAIRSRDIDGDTGSVTIKNVYLQ